MSTSKVVDSIFVSIASFRDNELTNTLYSLLSQAKDLSKIHVCIFSQDEDNKHPKLESLFDLFGVSDYTYEKINYLDSTGVGYARNYIQNFIKSEHDFYLQIDSHSRFIKDWDQKLIEDYNSCSKYWNSEIILTSYPYGFVYDEFGNFKCDKFDKPHTVQATSFKNEFIPYNCKNVEYAGEENGMLTGYFCAGLAFGKAKTFLDTPYDPEIFFYGEEQTLSIRLYEKGIKLIGPPKNYIYHDYSGAGRKRQWEGNQSNYLQNEKRSEQRLLDFYSGNLSDERYSLKDIKSINNWADIFVDKYTKNQSGIINKEEK
jgi:hypothetical protein